MQVNLKGWAYYSAKIEEIEQKRADKTQHKYFQKAQKLRKWHSWFAWYPVILDIEKSEHGVNRYAFFEKVQRQCFCSNSESGINIEHTKYQDRKDFLVQTLRDGMDDTGVDMCDTEVPRTGWPPSKVDPRKTQSLLKTRMLSSSLLK